MYRSKNAHAELRLGSTCCLYSTWRSRDADKACLALLQSRDECGLHPTAPHPVSLRKCEICRNPGRQGTHLEWWHQTSHSSQIQVTCVNSAAQAQLVLSQAWDRHRSGPGPGVNGPMTTCCSLTSTFSLCCLQNNRGLWWTSKTGEGHEQRQEEASSWWRVGFDAPVFLLISRSALYFVFVVVVVRLPFFKDTVVWIVSLTLKLWCFSWLTDSAWGYCV